MNSLVLLMALLGVSFLSGLVAQGRALRGLGLPSGIEWLALGVLLGPAVLGVVDTAVQAEVGPIALVAVGWLAFVLGLDFGVVRRRRLRTGRAIFGVAVGVFVFAGIAGAVWYGASLVGVRLEGEDRLIMALGLAAVGTETTAPVVHWVAERHGARGPLLELIADVAEAKDAVPIVGVGVVLCLQPQFPYPWKYPALTLTALTLAFGVLFGVVAVVLLGRSPKRDQAWGVLLGTAVLAIGLAARLVLPAMTILFAMGWTLGALSRHRDSLTAMIDVSRRPALLPALILAGARLEPAVAWSAAPIIVLALLARLVTSAVVGALLSAQVPGGRRAAPLLGVGMLSAGELSFAIGLTLALRFPDRRGAILLGAAAVFAGVGELIGPLSLRRSLQSAGACAEPKPPAATVGETP
jgi:hypothetical protein